jgi:signal transduction histidine kinase/CheY-like chemotaxis protein
MPPQQWNRRQVGRTIEQPSHRPTDTDFGDQILRAFVAWPLRPPGGVSMHAPDAAYPLPGFPLPARLTVAALLIVAIFLLDRLAGATLDNGSHFILLGTAIMAVAWLAGSVAALGATLLAAILGSFRVAAEDESQLHLALFLLNALLITAVVAELRRTQRSADARAHEAQAARAQAESANRLKDEFLATISHELRTPLNSVLGWVHLLRTAKLDHETAARGFESIERNVRLQAQLTSDLLDVSKALTGKLQLDPRPTQLNEAVRQAVNSMLLAAKAKEVRIDASLPPERVIVQGDPGRLRQIAWQLLANAVKFSERGGTVEITVDALGRDARLIVRDNGPGIDPQFLPRMFDRFTQADPSPTREAGGLGVGLALVSELVELHGGEIEARNRDDGSGAIFIARFPLSAIEPAMSTAPVARHGSGNGNRPVLAGLRVLVLDRDPEGRDLLRTVLQNGGAAVQTVASVADALQSLESWRPDVLVSDSLSPEHSFYALVGKVQALEAERGGRIPAVALTSVARTDARLRDLLADVQRDVPRPVEPAVLTSEIVRLAGRERRRVER